MNHQEKTDNPLDSSLSNIDVGKIDLQLIGGALYDNLNKNKSIDYSICDDPKWGNLNLSLEKNRGELPKEVYDYIVKYMARERAVRLGLNPPTITDIPRESITHNKDFLHRQYFIVGENISDTISQYLYGTDMIESAQKYSSNPEQIKVIKSQIKLDSICYSLQPSECLHIIDKNFGEVGVTKCGSVDTSYEEYHKIPVVMIEKISTVTKQ